jgi:hypothetical protein
MRADVRPTLHDHGSWKGPCSQERHDLITYGARDKEGKRETMESFKKRWLAFTLPAVIADNDVHVCACCGTRLVALWENINVTDGK